MAFPRPGRTAVFGSTVLLLGCWKVNPLYDEPGEVTGTLTSATTTGGATDATGTSATSGTETTTGGETTTGPAETTSSGESTGTTGPMCSAPRIACEGVCVDPRTDRAHCGDCSEACDDRSICETDGCFDCRTDDEVRCENECVDILTDARNCGDCGMVCNPHLEVCTGGKCECRAGLVECGASCVDLSNDPAHCGTCSESSCEFCGDRLCLTEQECTAAFDECDGACTDLDTDPLHCGDCARRCLADELCVGGLCRRYAPVECLQCGCAQCEFGLCCESDFVKAAVCIDAPTCPG